MKWESDEEERGRRLLGVHIYLGTWGPVDHIIDDVIARQHRVTSKSAMRHIVGFPTKGLCSMNAKLHLYAY